MIYIIFIIILYLDSLPPQVNLMFKCHHDSFCPLPVEDLRSGSGWDCVHLRTGASHSAVNGTLFTCGLWEALAHPGPEVPEYKMKHVCQIVFRVPLALRCPVIC